MVEIDKHDFAITNTKKGGGSKKMVASGKKKNKKTAGVSCYTAKHVRKIEALIGNK